MIPLLSLQQSALGQRHRSCWRNAGMATNCQSAVNAYRARAAVNSLIRGIILILKSWCPNAMGPYVFKSPAAVARGMSQMMASCNNSWTTAPRMMAQ